MSKVRYTEMFFSFQGEARFSGVPSVFLRLFGCSLRCPKFNDGTVVDGKNAEVLDIIEKVRRSPEEYPTLESLPLARTGCDSYPAIMPEFKSYANDEDIRDLVPKIVDLLPFKEWREEHLVLTGGEPLMWQRAFPEMLTHPLMHGLKDITFETNGTYSITDAFGEFMLQWQARNVDREITFSVSPKLSCSGEPRSKAIKPDVVAGYQKHGQVYLKYVVATEQDVDEAIEVTDLYRAAGFTGPVYLMATGGVTEVHQMNSRKVADLALKHGLRYSDRLHIALYGNSWAT